MVRRFLTAVAVAAAVVVGSAGAALAAPSFKELQPGQTADLAERLRVQYVFVGYSREQVGKQAFLAGLPQTQDPVVLSRRFYGVDEPVGLHYALDHAVSYADQAYEDAFFARLVELAQPQTSVDGRPRTAFQDLYNDQATNVLEVGTNHWIDAPSVERWLYEHPAPGVDPTRPTVYFVNWYGRPDFRFHTYTKIGEPDPDTGYDFGLLRDSRKMIAWGGTPATDEETGFGAESRVWFHDLSAGPEAQTYSWNVDDADKDGDGIPDYTMPPIWEYLLPGGERTPADLVGDLARVARYVAIDSLFAASPAFPPYLNQTPFIPDDINLDLNTVEAWPGVNASEQFIKPALLLQEEQTILRGVNLTVDNQDVTGLNAAGQCARRAVKGRPCFVDQPAYLPGGVANLFYWAFRHLDDLREGDGDYEAIALNYSTRERFAPTRFFLGAADDNYVDGYQSLIYNAVSPSVAPFYGLTTTLIHEYGHHFGLNHPFEGYDSEQDVTVGPEGQFLYSWLGTETNSMMAYIDVNWDFSQFDVDSMHRFRAAGYLTWANRIAADVLASAGKDAGLAALDAADDAAAAAQAALREHDYPTTLDHAKAAYDHVVAAAAAAGVPVEAVEHGFVLAPEGARSAARPNAGLDGFAQWLAAPPAHS